MCPTCLADHAAGKVVEKVALVGFPGSRPTHLGFLDQRKLRAPPWSQVAPKRPAHMFRCSTCRVDTTKLLPPWASCRSLASRLGPTRLLLPLYRPTSIHTTKQPPRLHLTFPPYPPCPACRQVGQRTYRTRPKPGAANGRYRRGKRDGTRRSGALDIAFATSSASPYAGRSLRNPFLEQRWDKPEDLSSDEGTLPATAPVRRAVRPLYTGSGPAML